MRHKRACLTIAVAVATAGCSDKPIWSRQRSELPREPFSIDCRLKNTSIGSSVVPAAGTLDPAMLTLQINPRERYWRATSYSGDLPEYHRIYAEQQAREKPKDRSAVDLYDPMPSSTPYFGTVLDSVKSYRYGPDRATLYLAEADKYQFRDAANRPLAYMSLDIVNRTLRIGLETRQYDYDWYSRHLFGGVVTATFLCTRSPKDTVIEVAGFTQ